MREFWGKSFEIAGIALTLSPKCFLTRLPAYLLYKTPPSPLFFKSPKLVGMFSFIKFNAFNTVPSLLALPDPNWVE